MSPQKETPPLGATGLGGAAFLRGNCTSNLAQTAGKTQAKISEEAREVARFSRREQVYEAAERASHFLACLMAYIAADDEPGIAYSYRKFATFGNIVKDGCKELVAAALDAIEATQ